MFKNGYDILYFQPKRDLYEDGNGDSKGCGKRSECRIISDLQNDTFWLKMMYLFAFRIESHR